jgi:outer membrane protein OmpA-like peptidoglycan-associated protein
MKNYTILLVVSGVLSLSGPAFSQASKELSPGYYVVVGAYAKSRENVAQNYADILRLKGYTSGYGFNKSRNLYFVYLKYFTDLKTSLRDMSVTRKKTEFKDAWVRVVPGDIITKTPEAAPVKNSPAAVAATETVTMPAKESELSAVSTPVAPGPAADEIVVTENPPIKQYDPMTLGNTEVFLSLYNGRNNRIVDGDVMVIDTERARLMTKVSGNEYLLLPDPKSKSGQLTLICESFGYRKVQEEINYPLPLADTVKPHIDLMGTTIVINLPMVRYHKGDIGTLYNVYFYNDASIMLPESKYELNSLLQMMQENPKYRIRLHGHTNGNYHGRILSLGRDKNFFSVNGAKEGVGSSKDLAYNRADIIKQYLIVNGIADDRMEIKSWGGKRPLYDKHSVNAKKNVRVEVEILEE